MNIKKALKTALAQREMTYIELAEKMGLTVHRLYGLKENTSSKSIQEIATALDMKFSEFVALGE